MKDAAKGIKCVNVANFTSGFEYAFEILHRVWFNGIRYNNYFELEMIIIDVCDILSLFSSTINRVKVVNAIRQ